MQRDADAKELHINLIEPAVYLFISVKKLWALQASESHSEGPKLSFFLGVKTNVDVVRGRDKKDKDSSFVRCSVVLPKSLLTVTELWSGFSDHFDS